MFLMQKLMREFNGKELICVHADEVRRIKQNMPLSRLCYASRVVNLFLSS
jgi:hypothetical protein